MLTDEQKMARKMAREEKRQAEQMAIEKQQKINEQEFKNSLPKRIMKILKFVDKNNDVFRIQYLNNDEDDTSFQVVRDREYSFAISLEMEFKDEWSLIYLEDEIDSFIKEKIREKELNNRRQEALNKLSPEERKLLGLV
jgi:hypothetical protein